MCSSVANVMKVIFSDFRVVYHENCYADDTAVMQDSEQEMARTLARRKVYLYNNCQYNIQHKHMEVR